MSRPPRIAVTGAGGYIGRRFCRLAAAAGIPLLLLGRRRPALAPEAGVRFHPYSLGDRVPGGLLGGVDALLHLAVAGLEDGKDRDSDRHLNLEGTRKLFEAGLAAGVRRLVFVSSLAARPGAPTAYGRGKWAVEQMLAGTGAVIVRPGLVYGGEERGVYGTLCRLLRLSPVLPVVGAKAPVQPLHVDELCRALLDIAGGNRAGRTEYALGARRPLPFARFLKDLARGKGLGRVAVLPVPLPLALAAAWICRALPFLPDVPRERVLGLTGLEAVDTAASLDSLGLTLGDPAQLLARERRRRRLLREGRALIAYLLAVPAPGSLCRRYVRALEALGWERPLELPGIVLRWPALLRLWEPLAKDGSMNLEGPAAMLAARLRAALAIAEASPLGARRFLALSRRNWIAVVAGLAGLVMLEGLILPARAWLGRRRP